MAASIPQLLLVDVLGEELEEELDEVDSISEVVGGAIYDPTEEF